MVDFLFDVFWASYTGQFAFGSTFGLPHAGEIDFAVHARRGRGQVGLTVFGTRRPGVGIAEPLGGKRDCDGQHHHDTFHHRSSSSTRMAFRAFWQSYSIATLGDVQITRSCIVPYTDNENLWPGPDSQGKHNA